MVCVCSMYTKTIFKVQCSYTDLDKGLEDLVLPVLIVSSQSWRLASVGLYHQSLHLDQQWTYCMVLPTEGTQPTSPLLLLEGIVVLYIYIHKPSSTETVHTQTHKYSTSPFTHTKKKHICMCMIVCNTHLHTYET